MGLKVAEIDVVAGGPSRFSLGQAGGKAAVYSSSLLVQDVLTTAHFSGAEVDVEVVDDSQIVQRVLPFYPGKPQEPNTNGKYIVARIATQRMVNAREEHLEVFIKMAGSEEEKAYNVFDPYLQRILMAAFAAGANTSTSVYFYLYFSGPDIISIRLGGDSSGA